MMSLACIYRDEVYICIEERNERKREKNVFPKTEERKRWEEKRCLPLYCPCSLVSTAHGHPLLVQDCIRLLVLVPLQCSSVTCTALHVRWAILATSTAIAFSCLFTHPNIIVYRLPNFRLLPLLLSNFELKIGDKSVLRNCFRSPFLA